MTGRRRSSRGSGASDLLTRARVAHLATVDRRGRPSVVPICFAWDGRVLLSAVDEKPKRVAPHRLRRVRNIAGNPRVAVVVDVYDEDWRRLRFVLIRGRAAVVEPGAAGHREAVVRLRRKYAQYRAMRLADRPVLRITPERVVSWAARRGSI